MSNEMKEWLAEREAYEKEVYEDFLEQSKEYPPSTTTNKDFIDYLLSRMYHGALPAKELK